MSSDLERVIARIDACAEWPPEAPAALMSIDDLRLLAAAARGATAEFRVVWRTRRGHMTHAREFGSEAAKAYLALLQRDHDIVEPRIESRTVGEWRPVQEEVANDAAR